MGRTGAGGGAVAITAMYLGDSITALTSDMPHTPRNRGCRILSTASLTNINARGLFLIRIESHPLAASGNGTLRYWKADDAFSWQANGDTEGPRVKVPTAGFYTLESGSPDRALYVGLVSRFKPLTDVADSVNVTGAFRLRNNSSTAGYMGWTNLLSNGALEKPTCYAISTIKAAEWLAARAQWEGVYTDLTVIFLGTNDVQGMETVPQALADIEEIVKARLAIGSRPIVGCLLPADTRTADEVRAAIEFNRGIRAMGVRLKFDVWDAWNFVYNPTGTGGYADGMAKDGLHPAALGANLIGSKALLPIFKKYVGVEVPRLFAGAKYDAALAPYGNLLANGQLTGTDGAKGTGVTGETPTGWTVTRDIGSTITAVSKAPGSASPVPRTDGRQGNYWSIDVNNANSGAVDESIRARLSALITTGFAVGDYLVIEGDMQFSGTGMQGVEAFFTATGGLGTRYGLACYTDTDPTGAMRDLSGQTVTVPFRSEPMRIEPGDTSLNVGLVMYMRPGGTGRLNIGQNISLHRVPAP